MSNLVLLVICFGLGLAARRFTTLPADSHRVLNAWLMNVSLPALVLRAVHGVTLEPALFLGASMLWVIFLVAAGLALAAIRAGRSSKALAGTLALCGGLGNTAFFGLPLLDSLGGPEAVARGTMLDQLGSFVALAFLAVPFAVTLGGGTITLRAVLLRLFTFPPNLALVAALLLRPVAFPQPLDAVLGRLADMLSPLALASIGWQLDFASLRGQGRRIALGLGYKMVLAPAVVLALLWVARGPAFGLVERVTVVQAAMPPMVTAGVLSAEHGLEPRLAAAMIAIGVLVGLVVVPLWWLVTGPLSP